MKNTIAITLCSLSLGAVCLGQVTPDGEIRRTADIGPSRRMVPPEQSNWIPNQRVARRNAPDAPPRINENRSTQPNAPWWQEEAVADAYYNSKSNPAVSHQGELIRASQIIAIVGNEPVLAGDLLGRINEMLQQYAGSIPEEELDKKRWEMVEQMLPSVIEVKMVYMDFLRSMQPEQLVSIRSSIYKQFDEKQLPFLVDKAKVKDVVELEAKMREVGSSLEKTRRSFFEQVAAREMVRRNEKKDEDPSPDQLLKYYRENIAAYQFPAEAKWEQLTVLVPSGASDETKTAAYRKLARMGNAVIGGAPFSVVARRDSEGPNASEGGVHDWVTKGSLVSETLDQAIFSLPIAKLSNILSDQQGFHIIRVLDRKNAGFVPFTKAQKEIAEKFQKEKNEARANKYIEKLKRETYVWNYFQSDVANQESSSNLRR